jgi:glycosyltransferase involved in cell wall biosynthesis
MTPPLRVLMVSRARYRLPLDGAMERKFRAILDTELALCVVAATPQRPAPADPVFHLVPPRSPAILDGALFYLGLPWLVARELRGFRPDVVFVQGVHETAAVLLARRLTRAHAKVVLDVEGNWRAATRLYGSPLRRLLNPLGDLLGRIAVRHADSVRVLGPYTASLVRELGVEPAASLPTYVDDEAFRTRPPVPLPQRPQALFVGSLEPYKGIDALALAWRLVASRLDDATLHVVGRGSRAAAVATLAADPSLRVRWSEELTSEQVADALDESTLLVLPSPMEGMGRVVVEALARGRPVIGAAAGGIADLVRDGVNGLLVEAGDVDGLADALVRLLSDRALATQLAAAAPASAEGWVLTPAEYARRFHALCDAAATLRA